MRIFRQLQATVPATLLGTLFTVTILLSIPAIGEPRTQHLYVAPNGSDGNPGTEQAPFKTILRASQAATPGTTVHVAPGIYPGGFQTTTSGTATARIYYRSEKKWGAKLVPAAHSSSEMAWDNRGDYVTIDGFEVDGTVTLGGTPWADGIYVAGSYDVVKDNLVHNIAQHLACTNHGGSGIGTDHFYYGIGNDVTGNIVRDIGPTGCAYVHGIYIATSGNVENNLVYNVTAVGIHLWHDATHVNIVNNTVANNETGIFVGGGDQYHLETANDHTLVANNISVNNKSFGVEEHGKTGIHNVYTNNLVAGNGRDDYKLRNGLIPDKAVIGDPIFKNQKVDFHLGAGSAAIDSGTPKGAPARDLDGVTRPQGAGYDIGAYEHVPNAESARPHARPPGGHDYPPH
jgi:hypothetical protein